MYYTIQIQLQCNADQCYALTIYEHLFQQELQQLVTIMKHQPHPYPFKAYTYSSAIPTSSHWLMYHVAKKMVKAYSQQRHCYYRRSGSWAPSCFQIEQGHLYLRYGETFFITQQSYKILLNEKQVYLLTRGKKLRLDLVHHHEEWYCNITMQAKE